MDPKQTEGQGSAAPASQGGFSFSSGQPESGQPPAAQPGTLSTGANVSRTMDDLNVNDRKSATSNSLFAKHQFNKIAPGTGDIIIGQPNDTISSAPGDKEPKINRGRLIQFGLIFGGIALVALVIFTVVMVVNNNQSKTNTPTSDSSTPTNIETNSKSFYSYILNSDTSGNDIPTERASGKTYALTSALASKNDETISDYFAIADKAFQSIDLSEISELADGQLLVEDYKFLSAYAASPLPSISKLVEAYTESGETAVRNLITDSYKAYDEETSIVKVYTEMAEKYSNVFTDSLKQNGANSITNEITSTLSSINNFILGIADIVEDLCISVNQEMEIGQ